MTKLPRGDEYNSAVQNPSISFSDAELKRCRVEETLLGLPKPYSGGFTITYKLEGGPTSWAVRCFHRDIADLQRRYQAISNFFANRSSRFFVNAQYQVDGIRINGSSYPIIKMAWLEGEPLNLYINRHFNDKARLEKILEDFVAMVAELDSLGIAHGDLQHGNIIVRNERLVLIDYDGMYLPELRGLRSNEIGHVNYQHPQRTSLDYNPLIDRFSALIIYTGLKSVIRNPALWSKFDNSENILFRSKDFADLQKSELVNSLLAIPEVKPLMERIIGCCHLALDKVPSLTSFINGSFAYNKDASGKITITRSQYPLVEATKRSELLSHTGEKIEIVGKISTHYIGHTEFGKPYLFLNFGFYPTQTFTAVVWAEGIKALSAKGLSPNALVGKWVSIVGVISQYNGKPQTIIDLASQLQVHSDEGDARSRLVAATPIEVAPATQTKAARNPVSDPEVEVFTRLYGSAASPKPKSPSQTKAPEPTPALSQRKPAATTAQSRSTATKSDNTYTPPTIKSNSGSSSSSNNTGCVINIVFALIGAAIVGSIKPSLWFVGVLIGWVASLFVQSIFKS